MTALVGGEVEGNVSAVLGFLGLRAQAQDAGGEDLADLCEPLGGGHQVGVKGVVQRRDLRSDDGAEDRRAGMKNNDVKQLA
jgi:hypothetical protein